MRTSRARGVAGAMSRIFNVSNTEICYRAANVGARSGSGRTTRRMVLRRVRGSVLRFVRRRVLAVTVGIALVAPAAWVEFSGRADVWWMEGLALIVGATGIALAWTGLVGIAPDWTEDT